MAGTDRYSASRVLYRLHGSHRAVWMAALQVECVMSDPHDSGRANARIIEHDGRQWSLSELAEAHGLNPATLFQRVIRSG